MELSRTQTWFDHRQALNLDDGSTVYNELVFKTYTGVYFGEYKTSQTTPSYRSKILAHELLPVHAYSFTRKKNDGGLLWITHREVSGPVQYEDSNARPGISFYFWDDSIAPDWDGISLQLRKKMKGQTWQAGVAWAEARKTSNLVTSTALRLTRSVRQLRRGDLSGALYTLGGQPPSRRDTGRFQREFGRDPAKAAGNAWLEIQYGWKPLLSDVKSAAAALGKTLLEPDSSIVKLSASQTRDFFEVVKGYSYEISPQKTGILQAKRTILERMGVKFLPESPAIAAAQSVEVLNPLAIAWELVPFSFVVDWFIPIGDTLSTLDAAYGKTFKSGFQSFRLDGTYSLSIPGVPAVPSGDMHSGGTTWQRFYKFREPLTTFPESSLPRFDPKLDLTKMTSGLALLQQQLSRLKK